jgi:hypothetical protein
MMDTLHKVMRSIRGETKSRPDHLTAFREFLSHLDRAAKRGSKRLQVAPRVKRRRKRKG